MPLPAHILARPEQIAETAITCGDPARTEQLAKMLSNARLVNSNRGFITYTGRYGKRRMTVATHGIGGPSAAIVFEELHMLGAETIVRFGTAGALVRGLRIGDLVIPTGAAYSAGSVLAYVGEGQSPVVPDSGVTQALIGASRRAGLKAREGLVFSSDAFYAEERESFEPWIGRGALAIEMECATLFALGRSRGFRTGALLMVSNSLFKSKTRLANSQELRPFAEKGAQAVFEALASL